MISFAKATTADAPALRDVAIRSFDDDARRFFGLEAGGPPRYNELEYHVKLAESRAYSKPHTYYKVLWGQVIVGGIVVFPTDSETCHLGLMFIAPEYQDRGIGAQCFTFLDQQYATIKRWTLSTPSCCTRNHYFYEKHGYVKIGEGEIDPEGFIDWKYERLRP
ncbi:MAG: GNAT family N-acetyltransferase [Bacillota bacterium]|nr:GNAT family N-acetyltransferase [Bacillota bacterium]